MAAASSCLERAKLPARGPRWSGPRLSQASSAAPGRAPSLLPRRSTRPPQQTPPRYARRRLSCCARPSRLTGASRKAFLASAARGWRWLPPPSGQRSAPPAQRAVGQHPQISGRASVPESSTRCAKADGMQLRHGTGVWGRKAWIYLAGDGGEGAILRIPPHRCRPASRPKSFRTAARLERRLTIRPPHRAALGTRLQVDHGRPPPGDVVGTSRRSSRALDTTVMLEADIASAPNSGRRMSPRLGYSVPAATGIATTL
jgi:hypothetical protein